MNKTGLSFQKVYNVPITT